MDFPMLKRLSRRMDEDGKGLLEDGGGVWHGIYATLTIPPGGGESGGVYMMFVLLVGGKA